MIKNYILSKVTYQHNIRLIDPDLFPQFSSKQNKGCHFCEIHTGFEMFMM